MSRPRAVVLLLLACMSLIGCSKAQEPAASDAATALTDSQD